MRAVILAGGNMHNYAHIKQFISPDDFIIAADSGYHHAEALGLRPHLLVGDFDSLHSPPTDIELHRVPPEKDFTDTELAIDCARTQGCTSFLFLGALGTRMDHTLTNILLLTKLLEMGEQAEIIDEHNRIWTTDTALALDLTPGEILSLIPLTNCEGVTTENLAYPLRDAVLEVGSGHGVSNVVLTSPAGVRLSSGKLLMMVCRD